MYGSAASRPAPAHETKAYVVLALDSPDAQLCPLDRGGSPRTPGVGKTALRTIIKEVVETARESLVIGIP